MKGLNMPRWGKRVLLFAVPALVGAVVLVALRRHRPKPGLTEDGAEVPAARVVTVDAMAVQPQALGYGVAVPARIWNMVAETNGKAVVVHPRLKRGAIVPAGTVLVEIDPTEYELRVAQLTAQTKSLEAQIEELALREKLDRAIWTTEQRSLELKERDVARQQALLAQKVVPQVEFEKVARDSLAQKLKTQTAAKAVQLVPFQRRMLEAGLAQAQAQLAEARNQLADTRITAPFECRIAD
ncbi:MAG: biotin/lipoyl-binding protein, partial [Victivallales bacterium]|nr:biotin/lipoyl-binding protein [Victivallales bacterium]